MPRRIASAFVFLFCAVLSAAPPSYLILMQRDGLAQRDHAALAPSRELRRELDKLGFVQDTKAFNSAITLDVLKKYNVIIIGVDQSDFKLRLPDAEADRLGELLAEYVKLGGGVYFTRNGGYQFGQDIVALNRILKPFGAFVYDEQMVDRSKPFTGPAACSYWTNNMDTKHPVTRGVRGLYYPEPHSPYPCYTDFASPIKVDDNWRILARASETASSFHRAKAGKLNPEEPGTFKSSPPFLAVREFGKGRVVLFPVEAPLYWEETHHPFWSDGQLMEGEATGKPADGLRLVVNIMSWLLEPSRNVMGGFNNPWTPGNRKIVEEGTTSIDWDKTRPTERLFDRIHTGLVGARSSLTGGNGTPGEFIEAAKAAGYNFIVFAEHLADLTEAKFTELAKACQEGNGPGFRAYPGIRYLDETGCDWLVFGNNISYPPTDWFSRIHPARLVNNNAVARGWNWSPVVLLNSKKNPQPPWAKGNYKHLSLFTYENGKLADTAVQDYMELNRDSFCLSPLAVHLVDSPEQVAQARRNGYQCVVRWPDEEVINAYSGRYCEYNGKYCFYRPTFVSEDPIIEDFQILNFGTSDLAIKDNDRYRVHISATSPNGIKELRIWDKGRKEPYRRFLANGNRRFQASFDDFHVNRREMMMEVIDCADKHAYSWNAWTSIQENEFSRCTDNMNTMPRGKWYGEPDGRHNLRGLEDYMIARDFRYKGIPLFPVLGRDEGERPLVRYVSELSSRYALVVNCIIDSHYIGKPSPNHDLADIPCPTEPNKYYRGNVRHTLFTCWQNGTLAYWVDGDFEVLKEFTERPQVATMFSRKRAYYFSVTRADGTIETIDSREKPLPINGDVPVHGIACIHPNPFNGAVGMLALSDNLSYTLKCIGSREVSSLYGYYGLKPTTFRPGDHIRFKYLIGISAFLSTPGHEFISDLAKLGIGAPAAYKVEATCGKSEIKDGILNISADNGAFCATFSQADLPMDLPVKVQGLNPNWDAGLLYKGKNILRIPVYQENEYLQRSVFYNEWHYEDKLYHIPFAEGGIAYLQVDLTKGPREVFIGNLLVCDAPELRLTCTDTRPGKYAFEAHNPTDKPMATTVRNAQGFTLLGTFSKEITVPAGSSVLVKL